jgi:hypothetical protein
MLQGIQLLQTLQAMQLQAGVMASGVDEAVGEEEQCIRSLLAALPQERLPVQVQEQLLQLGITFGSSSRSSNAVAGADDFELHDESAEQLLDSTDSKVRQYAEQAKYFSNAEDLRYVLEHLDELAGSSLEDEDNPSELLSSSRALQAAPDAAEGLNSMLLQLDQEINLSLSDVETRPDNDNPRSEQTSAVQAGSSAAGTTWGSSSSRRWESGKLQWPAGGKVSVLGQMKSRKSGPHLPPSGKHLGKHAEIKPNVEVRNSLLLANLR